MNLAPVCDVSQNPDDYIYDRTLGQDAAMTAQYVRTVVEAMKSENIVSVLKHFPGYGNNADTHTGIAYDKRDYEEFETKDFLPFQAGIDAGAECVLVSHNIIESMDSTAPASLSYAVHQILRDTLHFDGIIMTDDLAMSAIQDYTNGNAAAVLAVEAGNDIVLCTDFEEQIPAVIEAVHAKEISEDRIDTSVMRILRTKLALGMPE